MASVHSVVVNGTSYDFEDKNGKMIAEGYSPSSPYNVGAYAVFEGNLYRCKTKITSGEAWNSAHWDAVTVGAEVAELKGDMSEIKPSVAENTAAVGELKSALAQDETLLIACESGTFKDGDGVTKLANVARIRNKLPISVTGIDSITIPDGYQAWIFRLNANKTLISAMSGWQTGTLNMAAIATADTKYINIASYAHKFK